MTGGETCGRGAGEEGVLSGEMNVVRRAIEWRRDVIYSHCQGGAEEENKGLNVQEEETNCEIEGGRL